MRRFAGNVRKVWNLALARQKENREKGEKFATAFSMNYWLAPWKAEYPFLSDSPAQTLQQAMANLEAAYRNFFAKRAKFPRFKKRGHRDSFRYPQDVKLDQVNSRLRLPKLGWVRYRNSRNVTGDVKNVTVSLYCGKWFASIQTEKEVATPQHPASSMIGIDVGIKRFATLSDGHVFKPLNAFRTRQNKLAYLQRRMSRKKKYSNNWRKAISRVQKEHSKIANARKDFLHKTTSTISKNHAIVALELLQIQDMSKSGAGTSEHPGQNVRAKSNLNKAILDQGWGEFRRQLEYKQTWLGGKVLMVPPQNTSRTCPICGCVSAKNRKTQAKFSCVACGYKSHADLVGALNVLAAGHAVLSCGETAQVGRSMKQEPTESATQVA
jgi:putative transposase